MRNKKFLGSIAAILFVMCGVLGSAAVYAQTSTSANYQVTELEFGSTTTNESCSGQYCAKAALGDTATGRSTSQGSSAEFGSVTPDEPMLEMIVDSGTFHLGDLSTTEAATKTSTVKVRSYMSSGYMLQIVGSAPKYGKHTLATSSTPVASKPGTEQFGINLVANTEPQVGAAPVQMPSNQTSFGEVEPAYRSPNLFKFNSGDVVARSNSESGRTDYTVSMVINIANSTPAGHYTGEFSAVVIPVY